MAKIKKSFLIDAEDLKQESILPLNTDDKIIKISIVEATQLELEPLIREGYYKELSDRHLNDELTDKDKEVIKDYIKPFLIYATLYYLIPYLHNKLNNKGLNVSSDATLTASAPKQIDSFSQLVNQKLDSYKRRLINYFKSDNDDSTNSNPLADTTGASTGFYIPDAYDNGEKYYKSKASKTNYYYNRGY